MEIADLLQRPEQRNAVIALMKSEFPVGESQIHAASFDHEFAALLADNDPERILYIYESGDKPAPIAALAWKSFTLKQGLKVAALGLVVTQTSERKKGLSRKLILEAEKRAHADNCALICLWSSLLDFYTKLGYVLASSEISWELGTASSLLERGKDWGSEHKIRPLTAVDIPALLALYAEDSIGPARDAIIFERQFAQSDSLALGIEDSEGLKAYALAGKGRDLRNVIHEIVGDPALFAPLLAEMSETLHANTESVLKNAVRLQFPFTHPQRLIFEDLFDAGEQGAVCFAKILHINAFIQALNAELVLQDFETLQIKHRDDINAWVLEENNQDIFMSPDPAHLLQIFCSPWSLEDLEGLPGRTLKRLQGWQPFPLYFWGPDGV